MRTCHPPCGRWVAESLWATLTTEYYYRRAFTTRDQVYTSLGAKSPIEDERHEAA